MTSDFIPKNISPEAKLFLKRVVSAMEKTGVAEIDFAALESLGYAYHFWHEAREIINTEGLSLKGKPHPLIKIENDKFIQVTKMLVELGLTPKSRKEITKIKEAAKSANPLERYFQEIEMR